VKGTVSGRLGTLAERSDGGRKDSDDFPAYGDSRFDGNVTDDGVEKFNRFLMRTE
jgi:hypothetical protein